MRYYVIPNTVPEFFPIGRNVLISARTLDGRRVCAKAAADEFPDLFVGVALTLVELQASDFPAPPPSALF